ncbi:MAG: HlyD family efflux transporter periplasmic adaptor subunit [Candidatus Brocadiaceae bacterium]|nr:HlyD family efflux transporter periplasmic adaptor subunit [Candidatus Brocadiaceae bacterium]
MSTSETHQGPAEQTAQDRADARLPILALIDSVQQVCRPGTPPETFIEEVLRGLVSLSDAIYGAYWRVDAERGVLDAVAELAPKVSEQGARAWGRTLGEMAAGVIRQTIIRYQAVGEADGELLTGEKHMALGFPVRGDEQTEGCVTVVVPQRSPVLTDAGIAMLRLLADFGMLYGAVKSSARYQRFYDLLSAAWELVGETLAFTRDDEMAQVLADRSRVAFGAERASVGFVKGQKIAVAAISGEDILDPRSNMVRQVAATQTEVLVSAEAGLYEAAAAGEARAEQTVRNPQHELLATGRGMQTVYTVPMRREGEVIGAWTLEFGSTPLTDELRQVIDIAAGQIGPVMNLARQNSRGPVARTRDALKAAAAWTFGKEHPWRKAGALAAAALVAFAVFGRVEFNLKGSCTLEPYYRQVYAAPFDTTMRRAPVRPGDTVAPGDVLVGFDREELDMRLREARSKLTGVRKRMGTLLGEQKVSEYEEAKAEGEMLRAEIDLLESYLARVELRAEFAGIVTAGDLTHSVGRPVKQGEQLIEVAPLEEMVLEVQVSQGDVHYLSRGQAGRFTTKAKPDQAIEFTVGNVRPMPEVRGGASVYVAEALVRNDDGWLRPGMEGAAKVRVDRRNVTWVWTRKLLNWVRMRLWW